jgi:hypothetical protein
MKPAKRDCQICKTDHGMQIRFLDGKTDDGQRVRVSIWKCDDCQNVEPHL